MTIETRALRKLETRAEGDDDALRIGGYAAVFNSRAELPFGLEVFEPGAFTESLGEDDQVLFLEHAPPALARRSRDTLRLSEDATGLAFEADLPDTAVGRDLHTSVERGDLDSMSIGFRVDEERFEYLEDDTILRTVIRATLREISVVTFPAFTDTSAVTRAVQEWRKTASGDPRSNERRRKRMRAELEARALHRRMRRLA